MLLGRSNVNRMYYFIIILSSIYLLILLFFKGENPMKRAFMTCFYFTLISSIILTGCSKDVTRNQFPEDVPDIYQILEEFYNASYDYIETKQTKYDKKLYDGNPEVIIKIQGTVFSEPYKESSILVENSELDVTNQNGSKKYFYQENSAVKACILWDGKYVSQITKRKRPIGYGKDLVFEYIGEEEVKGISTYKYKTEFTDNVDRRLNSSNFEYTILQYYWIDKANHNIIKISSDLTELNNKVNLFSSSQANMQTYEKTYESLLPNLKIQDVQEIYYYNYDNPTEFEIPKHE